MDGDQSYDSWLEHSYFKTVQQVNFSHIGGWSKV